MYDIKDIDIKEFARLCRKFADLIEKEDAVAADALSSYPLRILADGVTEISDALCVEGARKFEVDVYTFVESLKEMK